MHDSDAAADPVAPFVGLHDRARQLGHWVWLERSVFQILGSWSVSSTQPGVAVLFGEMSRRHGWHAEVFYGRLPELSSVDAEALVVSPGQGTEALLAAIAACDEDPGPGNDVLRLVGAYRALLPLLVAGYRAAAATVSTVAEPSLGRWLEIIVGDDVDEWVRGEDLLRSMLLDADSIDRALHHQLQLEHVALRSGGLTT